MDARRHPKRNIRRAVELYREKITIHHYTKSSTRIGISLCCLWVTIRMENWFDAQITREPHHFLRTKQNVEEKFRMRKRNDTNILTCLSCFLEYSAECESINEWKTKRFVHTAAQSSQDMCVKEKNSIVKNWLLLLWSLICIFVSQRKYILRLKSTRTPMPGIQWSLLSCCRMLYASCSLVEWYIIPFIHIHIAMNFSLMPPWWSSPITTYIIVYARN